MMDITTKVQDGATVIGISGSLDGNTVNDAQQKIMPLLSSNDLVLLIDLTECRYISSAGLRLLLMAAKQIAAQNGNLALCGLSAEIKDVMEMTGFHNFFKTFDTVAGAMAALRKEG
ncbi:MAG: STAS domain-containing protein [Candidatus Omnitrophota bacterium]